MTGLVAGKDKIIEIAAIITDKDLIPLEEEGFERIIHCDEEIMNGMDEWCTEHHRDVCPLPISPRSAVHVDPGGFDILGESNGRVA